MEQISLWHFIFSGEIINSAFIILLFVLAWVMLYLFFLKYFTLKSISQKSDDFLENIADCIYDRRWDSAKDLCKRVLSPESRIVRKGLDKMEKTPFEVFVAVNNQKEIEISQMRKNLFRFGVLAKIIIFTGLLGTCLSFVYAMVQDGTTMNDAVFYTSFIPLSVASFLAVVVYGLKIILISLLSKIEVELKIKSNKFLEIIAENQ